MESSVSNSSENNNIAELGAEEGVGVPCNVFLLSSIEITALELDVRTATVSTNMMFFTGTPRQGEDIMGIRVSSNQFASWPPRCFKDTLVKDDAVTVMMSFEQANR